MTSAYWDTVAALWRINPLLAIQGVWADWGPVVWIAVIIAGILGAIRALELLQRASWSNERKLAYEQAEAAVKANRAPEWWRKANPSRDPPLRDEASPQPQASPKEPLGYWERLENVPPLRDEAAQEANHTTQQPSQEDDDD
jgi:hypothetical protein